MARLTNAQLLAELEALRVHCAHIEAENASLKAAAPAARTNPNRRVVPASTWQPSPEQLARRAAMAAAKAEAMRTGQSVRV